MKHRMERVCEVIKRELGSLLERQVRFSDCLVTVSAVDVTPDLKQCHVHISVLGEDKDKRYAMAKLEEHRAELQAELSRRVILKYTPRLHFKLDDSAERGARIISLLDEIFPGAPAPSPTPDEPEKR